MSIKTYVKAAILSSVLMWTINSPAYALFPTFDGATLGQLGAKVNTIQSEVKTQIESAGKLGDISKTLGDPKASVSKFAGDQAAKTLKDAEKEKKKAEKLKKIKDFYEKSRKIAEEKRKQFGDYQKQLEKAKKDYKEAKEIANDVADVASNAGGLANQVISDAQNQVSSKTGMNIGGKSSSSNAGKAKATTNQTQNKNTQTSVSVNKGGAINSAVTSRIDGVNKGNVVNSGTYTKTGTTNNTITSTLSVDNAGLRKTGGTSVQSVQPGSIAPKTGGVAIEKTANPRTVGNAGLRKTGGTSDRAVQPGSIAPKTGGVAIEKTTNPRSINNDGLRKTGSKEISEPYSNEFGGVNKLANPSKNELQTGKATLLKDKSQEGFAEDQIVQGRRPFSKNNYGKTGKALPQMPLGKEENISDEEDEDTEKNILLKKMPNTPRKGEAAAEAIKQIAKEEGAMEAANALKSTVARATRENDVQTLDAVSRLQTSDIVVSDSKKYEETPTKGRRAFSKPTDSTMSPVQESPKASFSPVNGLKTEAKELNQPVNKVEQKSQSLNLGPSATKSAISATQQKAPDLGGLLGAQKTETLSSSGIKTDKSLNQMELKAAPTKALQKNSYWLEEEKNNIKLSYAETLRFGDSANDCSDYDYSIQSSDNGEVVIIPKELAKKYCIKVDQLKDYQVIQDFLEKFALEMNGRTEAVSANPEEQEEAPADASIAQDAQDQYSVVLAENTKNNAVAAADDLYTSMDYPKVFEEQQKKVQEQQGGGATERDHKAMLALTSSSITYLLNQIKKIEAMSLLTSGFEGVRKVSDETLKKDQEIGLPAESGEYEASVTIGEGNYPVLPESLAKKCQIKVSENVEGVKDCLDKVVKDLYATDNEDVKVAQAFMDRIKYEEARIAASKGIEQLIRSAEFDEKLAAIQEKNADSTDVKDNDQANASVNSENNAVWTDFNRLLASSIADTVLNSLDSLTPTISEENKG